MEYFHWPAWLSVWLCSLPAPARLLISWTRETAKSPWFHSNNRKHQCCQHSSGTKSKTQHLLREELTLSQPKPGQTLSCFCYFWGVLSFFKLYSFSMQLWTAQQLLLMVGFTVKWQRWRNSKSRTYNHCEVYFFCTVYIREKELNFLLYFKSRFWESLTKNKLKKNGYQSN